MKLDIPKIVRPVDLGGYAEEMRGQVLYVWVNPPLALLQEYFSSQESLRTGEEEKTLEGHAARMREILAELLSQGPEELRWTADDISVLLMEKSETDPLLYPWLVDAIFEKIGEHRVRQKKA